MLKEDYVENKIKKYYQKKKINEYYQKKKINEYYQNKKIKENYYNKGKVKKQIDIYRKLIKKDIIYQILNNLAIRIYKEFKKRNITKIVSYGEYLGCNALFFKNYIEKKFTDKMSYDNYGEWEVDHIYPVSKIDFTNIQDILRFFHYTNLQPLWKPDNAKKSNKIQN